MSRDRRRRNAEPPPAASNEPLAPGPFEELFLKPTRPLNLDGAGAPEREAFPQPPAGGTAEIEDERESVIFSPFTPVTDTPPAFPQPTEPPPITMQTGVFKPAPASFEKLVEELLPQPGEDEAPRTGKRRRIPRAAPLVIVAALVAFGAAFLLRERLAATFRAAGKPPATLTAEPGDSIAAAPPAGAPESSTQASAPEPIGQVPAAAQAVPESLGGAPAAAVATETAAPALPPATSLVHVSWRTNDEGTEVTLTTDGVLAPGRVRVNALPAPPRVLVRLAEIRPGAAGEPRHVGAREVERVRFGYHEELSPPELYVVLDLAAGSVTLGDATVDGNLVRLTLHRSR